MACNGNFEKLQDILLWVKTRMKVKDCLKIVRLGDTLNNLTFFVLRVLEGGLWSLSGEIY